MIKRIAAVALALAISPAVFATDQFTDRASAEACAREFQSQSGESTFEVVKKLSHPGPGSYSFWMNSDSDQFAGFCTTKRGEVTSTYVRDSHWVDFYRPGQQELAAR